MNLATMARYEDSNDKVIGQAFKELIRDEESLIIRGMSQLLSDAMVFALESHDEGHINHLSIGDSYGWALVRDGKIVILNINGQSSLIGAATEQRHSTIGKAAGKAIALVGDIVGQLYDDATSLNRKGDLPKVRIAHAERSLKELASQAPMGWSGILMAGMEASHTWFSVQYETGILQRTVGDIESKFHNYFKPIQR